MATPTTDLGFQNFFSTTLTSGINATDVSIPLDSVPNADEGFLVIDPDSSANREVIFYSSKTGSTVECTSAADGRGQDDTSASAHSSGVTVIMAPVAGFFEALQSGDSIADASINPAHLTSGTGTMWAWQTWTPTLSGQFTDGDWTKNCKYIQIGKTVFCKFALTSTDATPMAGGSGNATFTLPVTATALVSTAAVQSLGTVNLYDGSSAPTMAQVLLTSTTTASIRGLDDSAAGVITSTVTSTTPFPWGSGDEISGQFIYEAA